MVAFWIYIIVMGVFCTINMVLDYIVEKEKND
jgi:hypothetical protein